MLHSQLLDLCGPFLKLVSLGNFFLLVLIFCFGHNVKSIQLSACHDLRVAD